jgi:hypothetical protein
MRVEFFAQSFINSEAAQSSGLGEPLGLSVDDLWRNRTSAVVGLHTARLCVGTWLPESHLGLED